MTKLYEILKNINEDVDYENCTDLIDAHHLDSLSIIALVADLEDEYDITIPAAEIIPSNFNSANTIYQMIIRLQEED